MKNTITQTFIGLLGATAIVGTTHAGEWGLGVGVAAQQRPQIGTDPQVVVLPFPSYSGERLNLDFASASYALTTSEQFRVTLEGQLRFDGYEPQDSDELSGLEERDFTLDAGLGVSSTHDWGIVDVRLLTDALGVHDGYELSASYSYPIEHERWTFIPSVGIKMPSDELVEYYYGVRREEATDRLPFYEGRSVVNAMVGANVFYELGDRWRIMGGGQYVRLGSGITDSPIIERKHELTVYSAIVYRF